MTGKNGIRVAAVFRECGVKQQENAALHLSRGRDVSLAPEPLRKALGSRASAFAVEDTEPGRAGVSIILRRTRGAPGA